MKKSDMLKFTANYKYISNLQKYVKKCKTECKNASFVGFN